MGKIIGYSLMILIGIVFLSFTLSALDIVHFKTFAPMKENAKREVFENTKSYVHGKKQELSKYYIEYQKAETQEEKEVIASVIKVQFSDFDSDNIGNFKLQQFLINTRGY